jgi:hypothetical protein
VLSVWIDDEDDGLDRTMAALISPTASAERWAGFLDDLCAIPGCVLRGPRRVIAGVARKRKQPGPAHELHDPPIGRAAQCRRRVNARCRARSPVPDQCCLVLIAGIVEPQERFEHLFAHIGRNARPVIVMVTVR